MGVGGLVADEVVVEDVHEPETHARHALLGISEVVARDGDLEPADVGGGRVAGVRAADQHGLVSASR